MLPISAFDTTAITAENDAVSRCHEFGSSVPFGFLQPENLAIPCSTGSQLGVDVADTVNAFDRCCANVEVAERELVQLRPRPDGLVFYAWAFFTARFPRCSVSGVYPGFALAFPT